MENRGKGNPHQYEGVDKQEIVKQCEQWLREGLTLDEICEYHLEIPKETLKLWGVRIPEEIKRRLAPHYREFLSLYIKYGFNKNLAYDHLIKNTELTESYPSILNKDGFICTVLSSKKFQDKLKEYLDNQEIDEQRIIAEYGKMAFFNAKKMFDENGNPKSITELDDSTAACIAGLKVVEQYEGFGEERKFVGYVKEYKLTDKKASLDSLAKIRGMLQDKVMLGNDPNNPLPSQVLVYLPDNNRSENNESDTTSEG